MLKQDIGNIVNVKLMVCQVDLSTIKVFFYKGHDQKGPELFFGLKRLI